MKTVHTITIHSLLDVGHAMCAKEVTTHISGDCVKYANVDVVLSAINNNERMLREAMAHEQKEKPDER